MFEHTHTRTCFFTNLFKKFKHGMQYFLTLDDVSEEEKVEMNKKKLKLLAQYSQLEYKVKYFFS